MELLKLKGKLTENKISLKECAEAIGMSYFTFTSKINGRSVFNLKEAKAISDYLGLTDEEKVLFFLS